MEAQHVVLSRKTYDFLFYVVFNVVLTNLVFGVILDTFGQLRARRAGVEEFLESLASFAELSGSDSACMSVMARTTTSTASTMYESFVAACLK